MAKLSDSPLAMMSDIGKEASMIICLFQFLSLA